MRAVFIADIPSRGTLELTGEAYHHLSKVVRIKQNEEILLLNGKGLKAMATVGDITRRSITLKIARQEMASRLHHISLAFALTKKPAQEEIFRNSIELGFFEIYPLTSDRSQKDLYYGPRTERLMESALEQSNNAFLPSLRDLSSFDQFLELDGIQERLVYFSSTIAEQTELETDIEAPIILIGPEGGFSPEEEQELKSKAAAIYHFPTPILRAPTAVCAAAGFVLGKDALKR